MKLILQLSLRNLFRQKKRSLFLGTAIAFGMMILVLANSFAYGITDNLLNKVIVFATGHMSVNIMEQSSKQKLVIRDKDRMFKLIKSNIGDIKKIYEAIGIFARVIGNGKGDNSIIVGVELDKEAEEYVTQGLIAGSMKDFKSDKFENPVAIYAEKAKTLGIKCGDTIKARFRTVSGQAQSARFTVVIVLKSNNMFESMVLYARQQDLKNLLGLKPHETMGVQVVFNKLNNPEYARVQADRLHKLLVPEVAVIYGQAKNKKDSTGTTALGLSTEPKAAELWKKNVEIISGSMPPAGSETDVLVSRKLAESLKLKPGSQITLEYGTKFGEEPATNQYRVSGIFKYEKLPDTGILVMDEKAFYKTYLPNLPRDRSDYKTAFVPDKKSEMYQAFSPEWRVLPRTATNEDLMIKLGKMSKTKWKGPWVDVRTMYETVDFILKLEFALNIVAFVATLILFFIILIGVLNTMRMTIRERTREIGTIRAIGMQKNDVKYLFIMETIILTAFACITGIILAFIGMAIMGSLKIQTDSVLSILLVNKKLYFYPVASSIIGNFILILFMAAVTAYFPSKKASQMSAVEALRHFE